MNWISYSKNVTTQTLESLYRLIFVLDVPGPVSGLEAKATTSFSILVSWSPPLQSRGFITKYKLYYRQVCIAFSRVMSLRNFYVNFEAIDIDRISLKRKRNAYC